MSAAEGQLQAGAARATIEAPWPVVRGGYSPPRPELPRGTPPPEARAVVLQVGAVRMGIVSVDLLTAPSELVARIRTGWMGPEAAGGLWVVASHAHTSLGAYDASIVSQLAGTGRFREDVQDAVVGAAVRALRKAEQTLRPATLWRGDTDIPELVRARSGEGADTRLSRIVLRSANVAVAELLIVSAHPTTAERAPAALDVDYPGAIDDDEGPVTLVLQGAAGNASARVAEGEGAAPTKFARALRDASGAVQLAEVSPVRLAFSRVEVDVPRPDASRLVPSAVRAAGDNLLCASAERTAEVGALKIGDWTWVSVPAELTHAAAGELSSTVAADRFVSLANGYLGYVDTAANVSSGTGESRRQYFGPELLEVLNAGAKRAFDAVVAPR